MHGAVLGPEGEGAAVVAADTDKGLQQQQHHTYCLSHVDDCGGSYNPRG
jgi:hypothetical protein